MYLVTGSNGQLGQELCHLLDDKKLPYIAATKETLDITNKEQVEEVVKKINPAVIFHCAAYTQVDKAEDEGKEVNHDVNVTGTENIANVAKKVGATLVYISTDYVFDGETTYEYVTNAVTNPQNEYGKAKLLGEEAVQSIMKDDYYIIRTSWVFGEYGNNFVYTMKKLSETHPTLTVINDQIGRPTWTKTLAEFMVFVIQENAPCGMYHLSNDGVCSWYEFAREILKETEVEVRPIASSDYPQVAKRPMYSVLNLDKTKQLGFVIPTWTDALTSFLRRV